MADFSLLVLALMLMVAVAAGDNAGTPKYAPSVVPLDSPEGYERLRSAAPCSMSALLLGRLATQITQTYCGVASLVTVFNAMDVRPSPELFGFTFWTQETFLEATGTAGTAEEEFLLSTTGLGLSELTYLASKRAAATAFFAGEHDLSSFRASVREALVECGGEKALIVNYPRAPVTLSGGGHHSPLGAYHNASDSALILDVSRYKFPPMWVPLPLLHAAMATPKRATSPETRGWLFLDTSDAAHLPASPPIPQRNDPSNAVSGRVAMTALSYAGVLLVGMLLGALLSCLLRARRARAAAFLETGAGREIELGEGARAPLGEGKSDTGHAAQSDTRGAAVVCEV